jgi:heme/copper-type cytochrome/quinol oxidase subunit 2
VEALVILLVLYGLVAVLLAVFMWREARRASPDPQWTRTVWIKAILLGPVALLLITLQRILPDPRDQRQ